jgi:malate dehydrogenase (oxaloacetate-decarboxylating)(NADP+)
VRSDAIIATGRSDYPNQVNNVLGFPYIFRGALDVRASTINDQMKIAAAEALAKLAREDVPDEVGEAYAGERLRYGPEYIIPVPFDPRLVVAVPAAVAKAAMDSGVARRPIVDEESYVKELTARLDPTASAMQAIVDRVRSRAARVVFAEGEEEPVIRAALAFRDSGYGTPILLGREERIAETVAAAGLQGTENLEIINARLSDQNQKYTDFIYERLQRKGALFRDAQRMVNNVRNLFGACMVAMGDADAMVSGLTRRFAVTYEEVRRAIDNQIGERVFGMHIVVTRGRTVFIADTTVHEEPSSVVLADIAIQAAEKARQFGQEPRVAFLAFSNFGNPMSEKTDRIREAVSMLDSRSPDFEYEGEISADTALDPSLLELYPFARLSGPANVLIMPDLNSANIAAKLMQKLGGGSVIGPILQGLEKPVQIVNMSAGVNDLVNAAALAAHDAIVE